MAKIGMDPDAIEAMGHKMQQMADHLRTSVVAQIDKLVHQVPSDWHGTDATKFQGWWQNEHRTHILTEADHLHGLGQSALNNATEQRTASGVGHTSASASSTSAGADTVAPAGAAGGAAAAGTAGAAARPAGHGAPTTAGATAPSHAGTGSSKAISLAESEIGTHRPTGWNQPGECVKSVQRWLAADGKTLNGGGVVSSYQNSGATQVSMSSIRPGDVIQYTSTSNPDAWLNGVHTVLVKGVNSDGSLQIVQSNVPYGSGLVTQDLHWRPAPPSGFEARVWRL